MPSLFPPADGAHFPPGTVLGDYVIEGLLGTGSEGAVHLARDVILGRRVALKTVKEGTALHTRCVEEARVLARLSHRHVLPVYHAACHSGTWCVALEFAARGTLQGRVEEQGTLPVDEVLRYGRQIAEALRYVHHAGWVHRDIKPQNLLLSAMDEIRLSDFGLALESQSGAAQSRAGVGTPAFLAPEAWDGGTVSPARDVYSFGICLYFMLTGQLPFLGDDLADLRRHHELSEPHVPRSVPRGVREMILALLHKNPSERPVMGSRFLAQLRGVERDPERPFCSAASVRPRSVFVDASAEDLYERACAPFIASEQTPFGDESRERPHYWISAPDDDELSLVVSNWRRQLADLSPLRREVPLALPSRSLEDELRRGSPASQGLDVVRQLVSEARELGTAAFLEVRPSKHWLLTRALELAEWCERATALRVRLVVISNCAPPAALRNRRDLCVLEVSGDVEAIEARASDWIRTATSGALAFTRDGLRVLAHYASSHHTSWLQNSRVAGQRAAARQSRWITSYDVLSAVDNGIAEPKWNLGSEPRPRAWPSPLVLKWLTELRTGQSSSGWIRRNEPSVGVQ